MEIDQAIALFLKEVKSITDTEICSLSELSGRVFAEDISSPMNVPHFPKSAMDGYALRFEDTKGAGKEK